MRRPSLLALVVLLATSLVALPALAGKNQKPPKKRKGDLITGKVMDAETNAPVAGVMIEFYPVEPVAKRSDVTIYTDLIGVDTSNPTGAFNIDVLSSPAALVEFGILRGWSYEIVATAPGYYQFRAPAGDFKRGELPLTVLLEPKKVDVKDDTGVVQNADGPAFMSRGKVVRGN